MVDINENPFPQRYDPEDEIFIKCMSEIKEFPQYITKFKDFKSPSDTRYISSNFKNLNMDSVRLREDDSAVNIEHHSFINPMLMRRNYEYAVNIFRAIGHSVYPYIFYTGDLPVDKTTYMNDINYFHPEWFILKEKDGMKRLNNIKYKHLLHEELNTFEMLDYVWLPKFDTNMTIPECIQELVELYKDLPLNEKDLNFCKECLSLWIGKYIKNKEQLNYMARCLKMSKLEVKPFEQALQGVLFKSEVERAEERAEERTRNNLVLELLKHMSPQEVSEKSGLPIALVQSIKNSCSK